jgi:tRNA (cytidine56-2'-O)-methyltransferase
MYGAGLDEMIEEVPADEDILIIVGAEKVPAEIYDLAHFNIAVGNQPHSEVSALALFLDRFFDGKELDMKPEGAQMIIQPSNTAKIVTGPGAKPFPTGNKNPFSRQWSQVPKEEECLELLSLLGASRSIIIHVKEVRRLGLDMVDLSRTKGKNPPVDMDIFGAGLLLHDIGRTRTHSIRHVTEGVKLSRRLGLDERIISIIHNHPGAGIPAEEAELLGLPKEDHIPLTLEEKIVCHSDNLVGSRKRRALLVPLERLREKGAQSAASRMQALHLELENILGIDIDELLPD